MMHRRELLKKLIQGSLVLLVAPCHAARSGRHVASVFQVNNIHPECDTVFLGTQYLQDRPEYLNEKKLLGSLLKTSRASQVIGRSNSSLKHMEKYLNHAIEKDYERNSTIRVQGWLYSETELKLCALHCISSV